METNKKFKCKDEVIYQNRVHFGDEKLTWNYGIVNFEDDGYVYLVGGLYINKKSFKILPYEGNEHLVGTTDEPDEQVQVNYWEWIMASNTCYEDPSAWHLEQCANIKGEDKLGTKNKNYYHYFVRFSDFNPNDMEETKKYILCVKNGKIIRYKG